MSKTTILIADDQPLIRDGLAAILSMEEAYNVVAKTGDGLTTIQQVELLRPQLVLMDIQMPQLNGLEATKHIKTKFPETKVLMLTTFEDKEYILEAIRVGASGFLVKGAETKMILSAIQDCLGGRINYPISIQSYLVESLNRSDHHANVMSRDMDRSIRIKPHDERWNHLSVLERHIVQKLIEGKSNQTIASELHLSTGTVKNYLSAIYKKLKVSSRLETIAYLREYAWPNL